MLSGLSLVLAASVSCEGHTSYLDCLPAPAQTERPVQMSSATNMTLSGPKVRVGSDSCY